MPETANVVPTVTELVTATPLGLTLPLTVKLLNVPTEVILVCAAVLNVPVNVAPELPIVAALIVVPVKVPTTPNVLPIVAVLLTVNADTVAFPLAPTVVNNALLGVTLPIGVACRPPNALIVVIAVIDPLLVTAAAVTLPVALSVETMAVLPPADPNVPLCGPLIVPLAVTVAPVSAALALPIVAAWMVVPFKVPLRVNPVNVPTDVIFV